MRLQVISTRTRFRQFSSTYSNWGCVLSACCSAPIPQLCSAPAAFRRHISFCWTPIASARTKSLRSRLREDAP